jgi:acyl-CoA synthetase (AMP-forming)/AMP-acid ligase II
MKDYQKIQNEHRYAHTSVFSLLYARYLNSPHKDFITSLSRDSEERYTYLSFMKKIFAVRKYLLAKNIRKGEAINIISQNSAEFLIIYFAAFSLGIIVCPINYNLAPREILYIIKDSKGKLLFVESDYLGKYEAIRNELPSDYRIVVLSKNTSMDHYDHFDSIFENNQGREDPWPDVEDVELNDSAVIIYTSGTSGNPKGTILTHANLLADAQAISEWFHFDPNTRTLCILPLFHNNGQVVTLLAPLWAGGSTVMVKGNISLALFWELIEKYNVTWTSVIPTILSVLLNYRIERKDQTLKGIICGGALLPNCVQIEFERRYNVSIYEGYGLTETTSFSCFNPYEIDRRKIGSIGIPLPINEMAIFNDEGVEMPDGEIGEICIRGYNVFLEYCNLPERNALVFRKGWFHSGDYGYRDAEGFFYIKGRKDDMIIKGGENIYPREIENVVYMHDKVKDCAVVGVEHKLWGEEIVLFIETKDNEKLDKEEIAQFLRGKIADYKMPAEIYFIGQTIDLKELPKGATNKILRKDLRTYYQKYLKR